jgi:putative superfamily III holin-X
MALNGSGLGAESASRQPRFNRSVAALLADLADQVTRLFRQEVALFKAELMEKLGLIGQGAGAIAGGALIAFSGWLALVAAAVLGLSLVAEPWLAALIVGLVLLGVGGALVYFGRRRFEADSLAMRRTVASLREDEAWVREHLS